MGYAWDVLRPNIICIQVIKIVSIAALEASQIDSIASIELNLGCEVNFVGLNSADSLLYALSCSYPSDNEVDYVVHVYALESLAFDKPGPQVSNQSKQSA